MRTCPTWSRSKAPFVNTTRRPAARCAATRVRASASVTTVPRLHGAFARPGGRKASARSFGKLAREAAKRRQVADRVAEAEQRELGLHVRDLAATAGGDRVLDGQDHDARALLHHAAVARGRQPRVEGHAGGAEVDLLVGDAGARERLGAEGLDRRERDADARLLDALVDRAARDPVGTDVVGLEHAGHDLGDRVVGARVGLREREMAAQVHRRPHRDLERDAHPSGARGAVRDVVEHDRDGVGAGARDDVAGVGRGTRAVPADVAEHEAAHAQEALVGARALRAVLDDLEVDDVGGLVGGGRAHRNQSSVSGDAERAAGSASEIACSSHQLAPW